MCLYTLACFTCVHVGCVGVAGDGPVDVHAAWMHMMDPLGPRKLMDILDTPGVLQSYVRV